MLDRRPASALQDTLKAGFASVGDDQPVAGQGSHEMVKLCLDSGEIIEYVCMVELKIVQDKGSRPVMHELGALVAERGIVFIGLDDEERRAAKTCRDAEIQWNPADQEAGLQTGILEDPREHRGSGGFAVRAGDTKNPTTLQYMFG